MIRKAKLQDLDMIMNILKDTVAEMHSYGNYQWDEEYPNKQVFINDINEGSLYVDEEHGLVIGFLCINKKEPVEYKGLNWSLDEESYILHRLAVDIKHRKEKVGFSLMQFAEKLAINNKIFYLKTDTYSLNTKAQKLIECCRYEYVGTMEFLNKEKPFYCYEKKLVF
jgi:N-acetylglutamate synthase-like GNAT family acetyltransferase